MSKQQVIFSKDFCSKELKALTDQKQQLQVTTTTKTKTTTRTTISSWTFSKSSDFLSLCATLQALVMSVKVKNTKVSTDGLQRKKPKKKQKLFHKAQASHSVGCGAT